MNLSFTPIHQGEILADKLEEIGISAAERGRTLGVSAHRILQMIVGKWTISADTALRLSRCFGTIPDFWRNLQKAYKLDLALYEAGKLISHTPQRPSAVQSVARH